MGVMKRVLSVLGVLTMGALLLPVSGLGMNLPRADLRAFSCQKAMDPVNRRVAVTAVMRPLSATEHMAIKFDLLVSHGANGVAKPLRAGDLGKWIHPDDPSLGQLAGDVWNLQKSVVALHAPRVYRFRVRYRWAGAHGRIAGSATRYSRRCVEPELRPDLQVRTISVSPAPNDPNQDLYTAVITNAGNSAAGPFDVLFAAPDGSVATTRSVAGLRAHSSRTQTFTGPVCSAGTAPTVTADSAHQVDDSDRSNNVLTATCPS
jgi:hypothetical protein